MHKVNAFGKKPKFPLNLLSIKGDLEWECGLLVLGSPPWSSVECGALLKISDLKMRIECTLHLAEVSDMA